MSNLLAADSSPAWTPNARFPRLRSVKATNLAQTSGRLVGLWAPAEMFRKGTTIIVEAMGGSATLVRIRFGGDGDPLSGTFLGFNSADDFSTDNVSRHMVVQENEGLVAVFREIGAWNGDAGTDDGSRMAGIAGTTVFIQPLNMVSFHLSSSDTIPFSSIEIIPGPSASGLRYQELLDV